jgi:hypothetical protein
MPAPASRGSATRARASRRAAFPRTLGLALLLAPPAILPAQAQTSIDERPNAFAMVGDLLVARPIGAVMTVAGSAAFVVSLPLTALAGSVAESAETLVLGPAETTFVRCLGCIQPGYSYKDVERRQERRAEREAEQSGMDARDGMQQP